MKIMLFVLTALAAILLPGSEVVQGRVIKYPLNVRAGAGMKYTAVAQLAKHNPVEITAVHAKWLAIKPPKNTRVWIMERYIKKGKLSTNINFRSGPSTGYEAVGTGRRGMAVQAIGKPTPAGWVQIAAPEHIPFYVGRPAIEADAQALSKLPKFNAPGGRPLPNDDLIKLEGNFTTPGKNVKLTGYLYEEKQTDIDVLTHVLYEAKGQDLIPKYFVMPNRRNLKQFNGKKVTIRGSSHKVKNWTMPVVVLHIISQAD